jgi:hypothetical protein
LVITALIITALIITALVITALVVPALDGEGRSDVFQTLSVRGKIGDTSENPLEMYKSVMFQASLD